MKRNNSQKCVNKVLTGLREFGLEVEIDLETYEILAVKWPANIANRSIYTSKVFTYPKAHRRNL